MFFFLSKVISFIIDPFFWIILLFFSALIHKKIYKRKTYFILGFLVLLIFSNSVFYKKINQLWCDLPNKNKNKYDVGILLGGMISLSSTEKNIKFANNNDRLLNTLDLFYKNKIDKILISGASGSLTSNLKEAAILKKYLIQVGIRDSCILIENNSKNTFENAYYCEKLLLDTLNFKNPSCLIITSSYHMRRSLAIFEKTRLECDPFIKKTDKKHFDLEWIIIPQSNILFKWKILLHEMIGYLSYVLAGYI